MRRILENWWKAGSNVMEDKELRAVQKSLPGSGGKPGVRAWVRSLQRVGLGDLGTIAGASHEHLTRFLTERAINGDAQTIMLYVPIKHEIDPILLASWVHHRGGRVCVGRAASKDSLLQAVAVDPSFFADGRWHTEDTESDAWGMTVPRLHVPVPVASLDAVIVPGLAFDRMGNRLGRGAGVYDRFLASLPPTTLRIGLIPSALLVDRLPVDPHDVPMHAVVTEHGVVHAAG